MKEVVIIDGVRTAIGRMGGGLAGFRPEDLAAIALEGLVQKTKIDPQEIEDVILGIALSWHTAVNLSRWAVLKAGLPFSVPGLTVERQCGSGLQAIVLASQRIQAGEGEVFIAGGTESHSTFPYKVARPTQAYQYNPPGFINWETAPRPEWNLVMGITAENLAEGWKISREAQDAFSYQSQMRAVKAIQSGRFKEEVIPVMVPQKKGDPLSFEVDEHPRGDTTADKLAKLAPVFKKGGTVTAGNSSGLNDGAAALLVMSGEKARGMGLKPLARVVSSAVCGVDPRIMGIAPAYAIPKALKRAGLRFEQMDVVECNEAFAAQTLAVVKELENQGMKADMERLNPNGGAVALGHPNGMSGARLTLTLIRELHKRNGRYGVASLCIGGGQGIAAVFEKM
jgi:acetyl-CoA acetyltransferase family protein